MATIEEYQANMTLFYSKSSGKITTACTGIADFSVFADEASDFEQIWGCVVKPIDNAVLRNMSIYVINLETLEINVKPEYAPKYAVQGE